MKDNQTPKKRKPVQKTTMTGGMLKFCEYYLETRNATNSYAEAYDRDIYTPEGRERSYNSVTTSASNLLKDPRVKKYIEHRMLEMNYERDLTEQEIVMQLNKIALGGQFKENTRLEALKMLSRMKGMYEETERDQQITINLTGELADAVQDVRKPNPNPKITD